MSQSYRLYLDACCLNRPFDDRIQPRIALETQAILSILSQCASGTWKPIASAALDVELAQTPDLERLKNVNAILAIAKIEAVSSPFIETRSILWESLMPFGSSSIHAGSGRLLPRSPSVARPNPLRRYPSIYETAPRQELIDMRIPKEDIVLGLHQTSLHRVSSSLNEA